MVISLLSIDLWPSNVIIIIVQIIVIKQNYKIYLK